MRPHKRTLVSRGPARRLPVGESEVHNMGEVCPVIHEKWCVNKKKKARARKCTEEGGGAS